jgi:hypothetical protein
MKSVMAGDLWQSLRVDVVMGAGAVVHASGREQQRSAGLLTVFTLCGRPRGQVCQDGFEG